MPRAKTPAPGTVSYDSLVQQALALPEVKQSTSYGTPSLKLRDKMMARLKEDGETVVMHATWDERERLMEIHPEVFFITEHYRNYPAVLMRLSTATPGLVERRLIHAWMTLAPKTLLATYGPALSGDA